LSPDASAILLRIIWPRFFIIIAFINAIITVILASLEWLYILTLLSSVLMLICYFVIPTVNKSKDEGNLILWERLHKLTVIFTSFVMGWDLFVLLQLMNVDIVGLFYAR
jgi:ABC-type transport system involved in cytochrome bd biosynthesis fused ATPase/permease subunit